MAELDESEFYVLPPVPAAEGRLSAADNPVTREDIDHAVRALKEYRERLREPSLQERYPEVAPFVESMYEELAANAGKGDQAGWRSMTTRQAWQEISWHTAKLAVAIRDEDEALIRELAADVANGCMMLVDIINQKDTNEDR